MRCPKCHYISFDSGERCRNCGYDFSLAVDVRDAEFALEEEPEGPLEDFKLNHLDAPKEPEPERPPRREDRPAAETPPPARPATGTAGLELPLFNAGAGDDRPLVTPSPTPRPPLAVRRATPVVPRLRERPAGDAAPRLHWETEAEAARPAPESPEPAAESPALAPAAAGHRRILAAVVDIITIGGVDLAVLYFTMKLAGLAWSEIGLLPWAPFVAFLLLLNEGYLIAFTAAVGQTIGKMALGVRVASNEPPGDLRPSLQQAVVRAAAMLVSVLPLGLGFLPALLSDDRRALHDRAAGTRVIGAH
jgi:uncharacterized RDD family membrane protein YckC